MENILLDYFSGIRIGSEKRYKNLVIFPIVSDITSSCDFLAIDDALRNNGSVKVTEVSDIGDVPSLMLKNNSKKKIFIIDGEELIGSKQNRVINSILLAKEKDELIIPVSCVERNRWNYQTRKFYSCGRRAYFNLRKIIFLTSVVNRKRKLKLHPQHDVWNDIDTKLSSMTVSSSTNSMGDIYDKYNNELSKYLKSLKREEGQIGLIVFINNRVEGCEIFSSPDMLKSFYKKIIYSYAIDAIETHYAGIKQLKTMRRKAVSFFNNIKKTNLEEIETIGEGRNYLLDSESAYGSALRYNDDMVYVSLFSKRLQ